MSPSFTQILNSTRSGMLARLLSLDAVSHNLSNINTPGFKRGRTNFQEVLAAEVGERASLGQAGLNGTQVRATQSVMDQGNIRQTGDPLDLAINGEGFFPVTLADGRKAYTRDGQFYLDEGRQIVTASGLKLTWQGQIPEGAEDLHVNPDGSLMVLMSGSWELAGSIQLGRFANPSGLLRYGQNLWLETEMSGSAESGEPGKNDFGSILGNAIEGSNVNLAEEMVQMMNLQRSFEISLRAFQQTDQMLSQAIHMRKG